MLNTKTITIWYRMDDNKVYQANHLEDGYDEMRTGPTPKVSQQQKTWKNGHWAQRRAQLTIRGPGQADLVTYDGDIIPV